MALKISQDMIPLTNRNRPKSLLNSGLLYITIHETGNTKPGADEFGEARFSTDHQGGQYSVAYHFAVGPTQAIQLLPLNVIGWHAGDGCDNRAQDIGCFASVAIETCVGDNNRDKVKTRANLLELIVAIVTGDSQIEYGGTDHKRFSTQRIEPHRKWSSYSKWCPKFMLDDGFMWGIIAATTRMVATSIPSIPIKTFFKPWPIPGLAAYRSGDSETIPAMVKLDDGTICVFVDHRVEATRETPRLRFSEGDGVVGPPLKPGEQFAVDWLLIHPDREAIYYSPYATRIRAKDTARVSNVIEAIAAEAA